MSASVDARSRDRYDNEEAERSGAMRNTRTLLLTLLVAATAALAAGFASAAMSQPGTGYVWAQPGTAPASCPWAQPPAWIPISAPIVTASPVELESAYVWAQPGT